MPRVTVADSFCYAAAVANMLDVYYHATDEEIHTGMNWYKTAHLVASEIAMENGQTMPQVAGVIAQFSPLTQWVQNVKHARKFYATGRAGRFPNASTPKAALIRDLPVGHSPIEVVMSILNGSKTSRFAHNILLPATSRYVTFDTWMARAGKFNEKRLANVVIYERLESMLQAAADNLGIMPHQLQAIIWVAQIRSSKESEG